MHPAVRNLHDIYDSSLLCGMVVCSSPLLGIIPRVTIPQCNHFTLDDVSISYGWVTKLPEAWCLKTIAIYLAQASAGAFGLGSAS